MLIVPLFFKRRKRRVTIAPAGPVLLSADFSPDYLTLSLYFDRAIDVAVFDPSKIVVADGTSSMKTYAAAGAYSIVSETGIEITMIETGDYIEAASVLNAAPGNGIVASSDASPWLGAADFVISIV